MTPNIKLLGDRILVKSIKEDDIKGGIYIPEAAKDKPTRATVVSLGTGANDKNGNKIPFDVKVDDIVLVTKHGGIETKIDGNEFRILSSDDILAILS